jgi:hypothetical protein
MGDDPPFDIVGTAEEHEQRADALREEAERELADRLEEELRGATIGVDATYDVGTDAFELTIRIPGLGDTIAGLFSRDVTTDVGVLQAIAYRGTGRRPEVSKVMKRDTESGLKKLISKIESGNPDGAPLVKVVDEARLYGFGREEAREQIETLRRKGEVYEPTPDHFRTT